MKIFKNEYTYLIWKPLLEGLVVEWCGNETNQNETINTSSSKNELMEWARLVPFLIWSSNSGHENDAYVI